MKGEGREGMTHVLSGLEVGGVTLLNDWFPSIKPYSLGTNVALNSLLNWFVEVPLMLWVHSCIMMLVTLDDLSDGLSVLGLALCCLISAMPILITNFPQIEPLLKPCSNHLGDPCSSIERLVPLLPRYLSCTMLHCLTNRPFRIWCHPTSAWASMISMTVGSMSIVFNGFP
jgi:hypothetical protein